MMDALFPIRVRRIVLRCLRDTDIGVFPEFRLGAFLQSVDAKHKDHADSIALEVPRSAQCRYRRHEHFEFRLYAAHAHRARLERIEAMLRDLPASASVSGPGIAFGDNWALHGIEDFHCFGPLTLDQLDEEVDRWRGTDRFRIRLASPWRITVSGASGMRRDREMLRNPALMEDALLGRLLTRSLVTLKFQLDDREWHVPELPLRVIDRSLWHVGSPCSPGGKRPNAFEEGLLGDCIVEWSEPPTDAHWRHLLLLARFGVGQSRAFGLGRMQLERIDAVRTTSAPLADDLVELCETLIPDAADFASLPRDVARDIVIGLHDAGWRACLSILLPAENTTASGVAAPESRLSSLTDASGAVDALLSIPHDRRECLRRALRCANLARTCQRLRLRMVWCGDRALLFSRSPERSGSVLPAIRQALAMEGIAPNGHVLDGLDDPQHFSWCGYQFFGGLALPGCESTCMFAVDQILQKHETTHQAA